MDRRRTEIAGRNVPVESGEIITIDFSGGPQPGDAGPKDFWVIFNERDAYITRWRHGEDPGERYADRADEQRHPIRNGPSFVVITGVNRAVARTAAPTQTSARNYPGS